MITNLELQPKTSKLPSLKYRMYWQFLKNIDVENWPKAVNATIEVNVLKEGFKWNYIDSLADVLKPTSDPSNSLNVLKIPASIEGVSKASLPFFYSIDGERVILVWERCSDGQRFIGGSPCSSGLLVSGKIGELENKLSGINLTFTGGECPEPIYFYDGPIILEDPVVVAPDSVTFPLSASSQYKLVENTSPKTLTNITNVTDADVGRVIEIIGAGSTNPTTISSSSTFLLRNAINFVATSDSRISLLIVKAGASIAFVEVHRA